MDHEAILWGLEMDKNEKSRNRKSRMKKYPKPTATMNIIQKSTFVELILITKTPPLHTDRPVSLLKCTHY